MRRIPVSVLVAASTLAVALPIIVGAQRGGGAAQRNASQTQAAAAGPACISAGVPAAVSACPSGAPQGAKKAASSEAPISRLHESKRRVEEKKQGGPQGPSIEIDVATLRNRENLQIRAKQLLEREIEITKRLIKNTPTTDRRRPDYLLRLAESYFEMVQTQNAEVRGLDDPIFQACRVKKNASKCRELREKQKKAEAGLDKLREANITALATLVKDHQDFRRMDEVLFSLGFALEEMKQFDRARQVYFRLIKGYPQSSFIPNAYLSFAEYYFQQGDMNAAKQFYEKVTEIPPERNKVYGYALYKMAWCAYNLEDYRGSLEKFVETVKFGTENPDAHNVANLVKQSRREMIMPYAQVGNPGKALEFFSRWAKDEAEAYDMFEHLGELYYDTGQWPNVIAVYHKLMAERSTEEKVCYWQTRVTNAVVSSKPKPEQVTEIERMVDLFEAFRDGQAGEEAKKTCKQASAAVLVELATAWHREAIGTDTQPGTNDRRTMELASKLYRLILDKFPDMETMEFPDIDRRDWPTQYRVAYFYAELLWKMESWGDCGPAFDKVVELNPQGEFTADAAYAAVLCYNKSYQLTYAESQTEVRGRDEGKKKKKKGADADAAPEDDSAQYAPKEYSPLESGMLNAFQRYICFVPDSEDLPTIKYKRARIFYETNHFEEASVVFRDIAFNHKASELSVYAANLYLDSLNVLASHSNPKRLSCYDEMNTNIEPLHASYCATPEAREAHDDLCGVLEQLRCDLLRKKAEGLQEQQQWKQAATVYVSIFRKFTECGRLDEVLYNAAINFEAARLLGRAIKVRKVLITQYPESEFAKRALYLTGANFHALAIYDTAADYYEQFASKYAGEDGSQCSDAERTAGTCAIASDALQNAVFFRLGLGDEEKAVADAELFQRSYQRKLPRETSQVFYSLGSIYERQQNWQKVIAHYQKYLKTYGRSAMPHEIIQANVIVGRAYLSLADKPKAAPFFNAAVRAWESGAGERISQATDIPDEQKGRFLAMAKIAAAEALFHQADVLLDAFKAVAFPRFTKKSSNKEKMTALFKEWMEKDFMKWMEAKAAALGVAKAAFEKIAPLEVPQWDIAAASRIGDMYNAFVEDFRSAPVPPVIADDEELVDIYYQGLDEASGPWVEQAKGGYEFCLITATRVQWFNQYLTHCEEELFKLDPRKYPRAAELRGSVQYTHSARAVPGQATLSTAGAGDDSEEGE